MNILEEVNSRFQKQVEYLGDEKEVNKIHPLVSVCVQTYQHAEYIQECLDGVLMQKTNFPFEIILGEDDSNDGTRKICIEYAEKYPDKIRLFLRDRNLTQLKDKEGKLIRRLNGIFTRMSARGEYIALCEGDDYWTDPLKLQKQVAEMKEFPQCDLSFHPVKKQFINSKKDDVVDFRRSRHKCIFNIEQIIVGGGGFCSTVSIIIKTYIVRKYTPFMITAPAGDYFMQVFGSLNGGALYIDDVMAVYRRNVPGSWSKKNSELEKYVDFNFKMVKARGEVDLNLNYKYKSLFIKRDVDVLRKTIKKICAESSKRSQFILKYLKKEYLGNRYILYIYSMYFVIKYQLYFSVKRYVLK